jgi:dCMP deaminase
MKKKWIDAFMDTAERFAQLSSAVRLKVGAVVVHDNRIISIGYNGMPSGWSNVCENSHFVPDGPDVDYDVMIEDGYVFGVDKDISGYVKTKTKDEVIHAEANAILKLARDGERGDGASIFITHAPCINCAKLIYGAGIKNVYYRNSYRDLAGEEFLKKCQINVENT